MAVVRIGSDQSEHSRDFNLCCFQSSLPAGRCCAGERGRSSSDGSDNNYEA